MIKVFKSRGTSGGGGGGIAGGREQRAREAAGKDAVQSMGKGGQQRENCKRLQRE